MNTSTLRIDGSKHDHRRRRGMLDFAHFRCTTCNLFAIHQPETPDMVQRRMYEVMSLDTLYPAEGSWQDTYLSPAPQTGAISTPQRTRPSPVLPRIDTSGMTSPKTGMLSPTLVPHHPRGQGQNTCARSATFLPHTAQPGCCTNDLQTLPCRQNTKEDARNTGRGKTRYHSRHMPWVTTSARLTKRKTYPISHQPNDNATVSTLGDNTPAEA